MPQTHHHHHHHHILLLSLLPSSHPPLTRQLHSFLLKSNLLRTHYSLLLSSYSFSNLHSDAHHLFDEIPHSFSNPVLFSSLISPLSHSHPHLSLSLFRRFLSFSLSSLDHFLFASLARLSSLLPSLPIGRQTHSRFISSPFSHDDIVKSSLVAMYSKCHSPTDARRVFDTIVHKNAVSYTAMVNGYASNGCREEALEVFNGMPEKNVFSWTGLISGFVQCGYGYDAAEVFVRMRREGVEVGDGFVLSSVVSAAADMAGLELGRQMHGIVVVMGFETSIVVGNSVVDMYAKCSDVVSARVCFERILVRDVVSWTTMIVGEAQHGRAQEALSLFDRMVRDGVKPNEVTFVGLIYACSHSGLVQKGRELFHSMVNKYKIKPLLHHYTCLLDLLSRSGLLSEAEDVIKSMPCEPDEPTWGALLSACKKHGDNEMSLRVADHLFSLKPRDPALYILLSNTYAGLGKWDCVTNVRKLMTSMDIKKEAGYSWIEVGKESWIFRAGEVPAHMSDEILMLLEDLGREMKKRGYVPDTSFVMHDLEEQEKVHSLSLHSERLAVAFGILKSVPGSVIRVVKNLRVCGDCHVVLKMMSEIVGREFDIRDANRFHHFSNGKCSCGDFW